MWINTNQQVIADNDLYTDASGTRYPSNFPKAQITDLVQVVTTPQPSVGQHQTASYEIVNGTQVWQITDWTQEEIAAYNKSLVPAEVTTRQAKQALLLHGYYSSVQAAIDAISDVTQRGLVQIAWEDSQVFERNSPTLVMLGGALGLTSTQMDELFIYANTL